MERTVFRAGGEGGWGQGAQRLWAEKAIGRGSLSEMVEVPLSVLHWQVDS